ncbi:hypothetical protein YSA_00781 [Pseudomonas putida ND6]|uniref:Uncharacterized protein n=1 Tax=Pseudomonas putida ND6 TaxID=231023 RepID=I3UNY0_PSEPU|nr:hypothetical protein YSA_00781 [Pseudomonas putida ND6]
MKGHATSRVDADEHLRLTGAREPDLNIDSGAVIELLVMGTMMKHWIRPIPKNVTSNTHAALLRL